MIERTLRIVDSIEAADQVAQQDDDLLTPQERFAAFMQLMEPYL